jgi:hypothetical protein
MTRRLRSTAPFSPATARGKAPINPQKMLLGPCRGSAVRLAASEDVLMVHDKVVEGAHHRPFGKDGRFFVALVQGADAPVA